MIITKIAIIFFSRIKIDDIMSYGDDMKLLETLNIETEHEDLYEMALTHTSYANEQGLDYSYERLEFLGDAVLELLISEYLYKKRRLEEGEMTKLRSSYVCEEALYHYSLSLGLNEYIHLGNGEALSGGTHKKAIVADVFEAFLAALYLDQGIETTKKFIYAHVVPYIENNAHLFVDYKSVIQELIQPSQKSMEYSLRSETGPSHDREFTIDLKIDGVVMGSGIGSSKKEAEQAAAKEALQKYVK